MWCVKSLVNLYPPLTCPSDLWLLGVWQRWEGERLHTERESVCIHHPDFTLKKALQRLQQQQALKHCKIAISLGRLYDFTVCDNLTVYGILCLQASASITHPSVIWAWTLLRLNLLIESSTRRKPFFSLILCPETRRVWSNRGGCGTLCWLGQLSATTTPYSLLRRPAPTDTQPSAPDAKILWSCLSVLNQRNPGHTVDTTTNISWLYKSSPLLLAFYHFFFFLGVPITFCFLCLGIAIWYVSLWQYWYVKQGHRLYPDFFLFSLQTWMGSLVGDTMSTSNRGVL